MGGAPQCVAHTPQRCSNQPPKGGCISLHQTPVLGLTFISTLQDANIWGHAALLAILADHAAEAEQALTWAMKLQLQDTALMAQIAEQLIERRRQALVLILLLTTACCLWSTCSLLTGILPLQICASRAGSEAWPGSKRPAPPAMAAGGCSV